MQSSLSSKYNDKYINILEFFDINLVVLSVTCNNNYFQQQICSSWTYNSVYDHIFHSNEFVKFFWASLKEKKGSIKKLISNKLIIQRKY